MFTGIIECTGRVEVIKKWNDNVSLIVSSKITTELRPDQSVSHNGVCLTVETVTGSLHTVTAVKETLQKSNLGLLKEGDIMNIERCLSMNGRLDGHLVQGHVDGTGYCQSVKDAAGSWEVTFSFDSKFAPLLIEKGSVCVNGVSLTAFNVCDDTFTVAIIPYTWQRTNLQYLSPGAQVNFEWDIIGKYLLRFKQIL
jgi:riboflavin synthase